MVLPVRDRVAALLDARPGVEIQDVLSLDGVDFHFKFVRSPCAGAPLIIRFHGSVKRDTRPIPVFQSNLKAFRGGAHQISIADPSLFDRPSLSCAWYAGREDLDVQGTLLRVVAAVRAVLGPRRVVYHGSSGGGFAALYCSYFDPGSIALVMVPQTNLQRHFIPRSVQRYVDTCWSGRPLDEVCEIVCTDVTRLYSEGFGNTVVYVQSQGDFMHTSSQMTPFLSACFASGDLAQERVVVHSDYWGRPGHGGAVPLEGYRAWLQAAVSAPTPGLEDLLATARRFAGVDREPARIRPPSVENSVTSNELFMTEMVKNGLLGRFESIREGL